MYTSPFGEIELQEIDSVTLVINRKKPSGPCMIDAVTGQSMTFEQQRNMIKQFASGIFHSELKKWDVVAVYSPNSVYYPVVIFGTLAAGLTITTANPSYTADELSYQLKDSGAKIIITIPEVLDNAIKAATANGIPKSKIYIMGENEHDGFKPITSIFSSKPFKVSFSKEEIHLRPAYLCYSSGTTGRSKGVETTHFNMVSNVLQYCATMKPLSGDVWIGLLPFYHIYAMNITVHVANYLGIPVVVFPKFELPLFLSNLEKYRVTLLHIVPPIVLALAKHPIVDKYNLKSVKRILSGAAPLSAEVVTEVQNRLHVIVTQGYGMTETSPVTHVLPEDDAVVGSIGFPVPHVKAKLVNPETGDEILERNVRGELCVHGPNIMKGYRNNPEATKNTIDKDGWLHTGDIAIVDDRGHFFIVDRLKELIKYKGLQVAPAELEAKLLTHPKIADCGVVSIPDQRAGELPLAFVVLKSNMTATETEIQEFVAKSVADHKKLRGGVLFIDAIPKSASGKILRRELKAMIKGKL